MCQGVKCSYLRGTTFIFLEGLSSRKEIQQFCGRQEGNILFNNTHNTFHLQLYGIRYMVKDHSDSERGNPLPPHGYSFQLAARFPDRITHTMAFVTPVVEHWLEREIAQWVNHEGSIWWPIAPWVNTLTIELHLAPQSCGHSKSTVKIYKFFIRH